MKLVLYGKEDCGLCEQARVILEVLQQDYPFEMEEVNIYNDHELLEKYHLMIPVITDNEKVIDSEIIDMEIVEHYLKSKKYSENS